jgi:archaellum component FlaF (FlaF/FlaG flagellin family)
MRMLVAFLIVLGVLYIWDVNYNSGVLSAGVISMLQDIDRSIR